jgi:hypothetical protein
MVGETVVATDTSRSARPVRECMIPTVEEAGPPRFASISLPGRSPNEGWGLDAQRGQVQPIRRDEKCGQGLANVSPPTQQSHRLPSRGVWR